LDGAAAGVRSRALRLAGQFRPSIEERAAARPSARSAVVPAALVAAIGLAPNVSLAQDKKPNLVVIFGDDIGLWNVGYYTHGMMGRTPNIDRIGREGICFTDHYGQPSCTAGRAAFITGQRPA